MKVVAVCISKYNELWQVPGVPFYCYTEGYRPILHHDNNDPERIQYLTGRYNRAIELALQKFPESEHILVADSYYLPFVSQIRGLLTKYSTLEASILGASIWYWDRSHIRACIRYYDTLSVWDMRGRKWYAEKDLPSGLIRVNGVAACFVFPVDVWVASGQFSIPYTEPQAGGTRGLKTAGYRILLDCEDRLWRTHANSPGIAEFPLWKRVRYSLGDLRRQIIHR